MATVNSGGWVDEGGTAVFSITFKDEADAEVTPTSATWTLTSQSDPGVVINALSDQVITITGSTATVILKGDDLLIGAYGSDRELLVRYVYTSDAGAGLIGTPTFPFRLRNRAAL